MHYGNITNQTGKFILLHTFQGRGCLHTVLNKGLQEMGRGGGDYIYSSLCQIVDKEKNKFGHILQGGLETNVKQPERK